VSEEVKASDLKAIRSAVSKNFDEQKEFLSELVKEKSVNPLKEGFEGSSEEGVARVIRKKLKEIGVNSRYLRYKKKRPNLVAVWGPTRSRKSLAWVGHMDTEEPLAEDKKKWFSGEIEGNKLYGVGSLDMKGSLSAYVFALKALIDSGLETEGKLRLAFTSDGKSEYVSRWGLKYLVNKGLKAKVALLAKPGTKKIAIGHRGGYRFKITVKGESVDTGRRAWEKGEKGVNAVVGMMKVAEVLRGFDLPFRQARAFPDRLPVFTFPTRVQGGKSIDVVPNKCEAWGDVRLLPGNTDKQIRWWLKNRLRKLEGVDWEIEDILFVPAMEVDKTDRWVKCLAEQASEVLGKKPKLEGCGPWNDAWMLTQTDTPCLAGFGPDGQENGEGEEGEEWVDLQSLKKVTEIYARWALMYLGKKGKK